VHLPTVRDDALRNGRCHEIIQQPHRADCSQAPVRAHHEGKQDDNFSKRLSRVFSKVYGENITNQDLRTAYATYFTTRAKNKTEKNKVANALSHSFEVNEQYVKVNVKKSDSDITTKT
jgi:hypothetical protein